MFQKSWDRETKKYAKLNGTEKKQPVMIVYKKSILERQNFSEVKMSRCFAKICIYKLWNNSVIFGLPGSTELQTGTFVSWKSLHGLGNTSRNHCLQT